MSIRVEYGDNTFYYRSIEGRNSWVVWDGRSGDFKNRSGMIVPSQFNVDIYRSAIQQGYTEADFDKMRTYAPTKPTRGSTASVKRIAATKAPRIVSEKKVTQKKSTLSNSIKLF